MRLPWVQLWLVGDQTLGRKIQEIKRNRRRHDKIVPYSSHNHPEIISKHQKIILNSFQNHPTSIPKSSHRHFKFILKVMPKSLQHHVKNSAIFNHVETETTSSANYQNTSCNSIGNRIHFALDCLTPYVSNDSLLMLNVLCENVTKTNSRNHRFKNLNDRYFEESDRS